MNMLRLFESAIKQEIETQLPFLQSIYITNQNKKGDKKNFNFLVFFLASLFLECTAPPPVVHSSGITLLNTILQENSKNLTSQSVISENSTSTPVVDSSGDSNILDEETSSSDAYLIYPRSEFVFFTGDWIEISPAETKNVQSAKVLGKLPDGLEFNESSMTLFGSLETSLKKTQIKIKATTIDKSNYVTKFYLTVEEKPKVKPEKPEPNL